VVVVGGTHGNEYTGVWCVKSLETRQEWLRKEYPSISSIITMIGNPKAVKISRRFVDTDLNREFSGSRLLHSAAAASSKKDDSVERKRARELNELLGPKEAPTTDLIIDLHSTTSNMGLTLIVPEGDVIMTQAAAYVKSVHKDAHILMHAIPNRDKRPNLSSIARHGFTIEVGPVPQSVLRHDAVERTEAALFTILDFVEIINTQSQRTIIKKTATDVS